MSTNLEIGGFHKLCCPPGLDIGDMLISIGDGLGGFGESVEDIPRLQDQFVQGVDQAIDKRGYGRQWAEGE